MHKIALIGNPNSGKTTLFNLLTGDKQTVGNWPGVTVEKKEGQLIGRPDVWVADLPGVYSLSPYTKEEVVTRDYVFKEHPDMVINIVDGTNLERNLYLSTQVMELGLPVIMAVNMLDVVRERGYRIDLVRLQNHLHCRCVAISALTGSGIDQLVAAVDQCMGEEAYHMVFSGEVESALKGIAGHLPADMSPALRRWFAVKLFERDSHAAQFQPITPGMEALISAVEMRREDDSESIVVEERYSFVERTLSDCYYKTSGRVTPTERIDKIVTNRLLSLPIFVLVMFAIYSLAVTGVGALCSDFVNETLFGRWICGGLARYFAAQGVSPELRGLVVDGMIGGVGSVLGFLPQMFALFFFLSLLEECGYMSRIAFILDRIFRRFGLSGKSFIPMLVGTGCGVPGIMASRTIESVSDRRMTIMTTTFMPCGAKMPIVALIAGSVMHGAWWVAPSAYFVGVCSVIVSGLILKKTRPFRSEATPFVMELPDYHLPTLGSVLGTTWERGFSFVKKAGTIILLASVAIWFLSNYGLAEGALRKLDINGSFLAHIGGLLAPLFRPLGFGNWQSAVATLMGLMAKEEVVSVFGALYGLSDGGPKFAEHFTKINAYSFMVFNLLCAPCFAAVAAIRKEMNSRKWTLFALAYQTVFAYVISFIIYRFSLFLARGHRDPLLLVAAALALLLAYLIFRPDHNPTTGRKP